MVAQRIRRFDGNLDKIHPIAVVRYGNLIQPKARYIRANANEPLASITMRAYGANTPELRAKIRSANTSLTGLVRIPN